MKAPSEEIYGKWT